MPRVNINISEDLKEYFETISKNTGVSQSAIMCLALYEYVAQKKGIDNLGAILDKLEITVPANEDKEL